MEQKTSQKVLQQFIKKLQELENTQMKHPHEIKTKMKTLTCFRYKDITEKAITSQCYTIHLLILYMSKAFNTVDRGILLKDSKTILVPEELYLIKIMPNSFMTVSLSYRNQSIDLVQKSIKWLLYDNDHCHERVNTKLRVRRNWRK